MKILTLGWRYITCNLASCKYILESIHSVESSYKLVQSESEFPTSLPPMPFPPFPRPALVDKMPYWRGESGTA